MAHVLASELRKAVLKAAFKGDLSENSPLDSSAFDYLLTIQKIQEKKAKNKEIKIGKFSKEIINDFDFDFPKHWALTKMGFITSLVTKQTGFDYSNRIKPNLLEKKQNNSYPLIQTRNFKGTDFNFDSKYYLPIHIADEYPNLILNKPCLLLSIVGASIGNIGLYTDEKRVGFIGGAISKVDLISNEYLKYIYYYLQSPLGNYQIMKNYKSTAQGTITVEDVRNIIIPFPPIEEQARIVTRVDELMTKIDEYEKLENELVELKKNFPGDMKAAVLQAAMQGKLTDQNELERPLFFDKKVNMDDYEYDLPDNWTVVKMSSVSELYTGNSIPEAIKKSKYMGLSDGMNYIGTKDVGFDHVIDYENGVKIPFGEPKFKVAKKEATLLCVEGGSAGKKMGVIKENVCFGNKLCSFNAGKHIDSKFQYYVIQSPIFGKMFTESISGMIGGVSVNKLKDMLIPLPPIEEQKRIVEKLDKILPLCEELEKEIA